MKALKENPIAAQSKQMILKALLELMERKAYHSISIKELAEYAGLDRKTFYRNFKSKEDVLYLRLHKLCQLYRKELEKLPQFTLYSITKAYFLICKQDADFFMLLKKNDLLPLALMKFDEYLAELITLFLDDPAYRRKSQYEIYYQAGGFWNVTIRWLEGGAKESPEEMAQIIGAIMPPLKIEERM